MAVSLAWWVLFATCFGTESSPLLLQKKIHLADTPKPKRSLEEQLEVLEVTDLHDLAGKSVYLVMIDRFSREGGHSTLTSMPRKVLIGPFRFKPWVLGLNVS
eukprot:g130.t1